MIKKGGDSMMIPGLSAFCFAVAAFLAGTMF